MGVDQLVTGGDVDNPVFQSVSTGDADIIRHRAENGVFDQRLESRDLLKQTRGYIPLKAQGITASPAGAWLSSNISGGKLVCSRRDTGKISLVDVTNGMAPLVTDTLDVSLNGVTGTTLDGDLIYVTGAAQPGDDETKHGFTIVDARNPNSLTELGSVYDSGTDEYGFWKPTARDRYAYVPARGDYDTAKDGGFYVIDCTDPSNPSIVGSVTDGTVREGRAVELVGDTAIVTDFANQTTDYGAVLSIDVSDPTSPTVLDQLRKQPYENSRRLVVRDGVAYSTAISQNNVNATDISDPSSLHNLDTVSDNTNLDSPQGIANNGQFLYVASRNNRLSVVDARDPTNLDLRETYVHDAPIREVETDGQTVFARTDTMAGGVTDPQAGSVLLFGASAPPEQQRLRRNSLTYRRYMWMGGVSEAYTNTANSGSFSVGENGGSLRLKTGTTADSEAYVAYRTGGSAGSKLPRWTWNADRTIRVDIEYPNALSQAMYWVNGNIGLTTRRHVGIKIEGGTLKGTVGNGSSQSLTTLKTGLAAPVKFEFLIEFDAHDKVRWYVDGVLEGTETDTSAMPSSDSNDNRSPDINHKVLNASSSAVDGIQNVHREEIVQPFGKVQR